MVISSQHSVALSVSCGEVVCLFIEARLFWSLLQNRIESVNCEFYKGKWMRVTVYIYCLWMKCLKVCQSLWQIFTTSFLFYLLVFLLTDGDGDYDGPDLLLKLNWMWSLSIELFVVPGFAFLVTTGVTHIVLWVHHTCTSNIGTPKWWWKFENENGWMSSPRFAYRLENRK